MHESNVMAFRNFMMIGSPQSVLYCTVRSIRLHYSYPVQSLFLYLFVQLYCFLFTSLAFRSVLSFLHFLFLPFPLHPNLHFLHSLFLPCPSSYFLPLQCSILVSPLPINSHSLSPSSSHFHQSILSSSPRPIQFLIFPFQTLTCVSILVSLLFFSRHVTTHSTLVSSSLPLLMNHSHTLLSSLQEAIMYSTISPKPTNKLYFPFSFVLSPLCLICYSPYPI